MQNFKVANRYLKKLGYKFENLGKEQEKLTKFNALLFKAASTQMIFSNLNLVLDSCLEIASCYFKMQ